MGGTNRYVCYDFYTTEIQADEKTWEELYRNDKLFSYSGGSISLSLSSIQKFSVYFVV